MGKSGDEAFSIIYRSKDVDLTKVLLYTIMGISPALSHSEFQNTIQSLEIVSYAQCTNTVW